MAITVADMKAFVPGITLDDARLQKVIDFAGADIDRFSTVQDAKRDEQIVRWVKCWLAYEGFSAVTQMQYSREFKNSLNEIASERWSL